VDEERRGIWRYAPLLPYVPPSDAVSLGEGATPLVWIDRWAGRHGLGRVAVKLEYLNPTGSFKDRGTALLVSQARALGLGRMIEDSSGNAGASVAAYAARAGLPSTIFVPATAPAAKRGQIRRVGATIVPVEGSRAAVTEQALAEVARTGAYYAGHNANPYFLAGMATFAYELIEELGPEQPRHLVIPTGGGSLLVGSYDGYRHWGDDIPNDFPIPRLHAVQPAGCPPIVVSWREGRDEAARIERRPTIAGGIEVENPPRGRRILNAIRATGGTAVAVGDDEIRAERRALAEAEGIDVEPTTAAAFAGLARLAREGVVRPDESVVVAATGAGWKD
jgi:threonine synthase